MSVRVTIVLLFAALAGLVFGGLSFLATRKTTPNGETRGNVAAAVMVGLTAAGAAAIGLNQLLDPST